MSARSRGDLDPLRRGNGAHGCDARAAVMSCRRRSSVQHGVRLHLPIMNADTKFWTPGGARARNLSKRPENHARGAARLLHNELDFVVTLSNGSLRRE
jgi:hypothetical protein